MSQEPKRFEIMATPQESRLDGHRGFHRSLLSVTPARAPRGPWRRVKKLVRGLVSWLDRSRPHESALRLTRGWSPSIFGR